MSTPLHPDWPVLSTFAGAHLRRVALPLGGIGTGTVSLGGRGDLRDWEVQNHPAKGGNSPNKGAFFALWVRTPEGATVTRALEGPIDLVDFEGSSGCPVPNHGLPRFAQAAFHVAYPLAQLLLDDPEVPLQVRLEAFNPLLPGDADASGLPVAVLRYVLINRSEVPLEASVCGTTPHFIEAGGTKVCETREGATVRGVLLRVEEGDAGAEAWGTLALTTTAPAITTRTAWEARGWGGALLDFWDDFSADGQLEARAGTPTASVAATVTVPPQGECAVTFLLTWHFPNRKTWTPVEATASCECGGTCGDPNWIGNYYCTQFADAWAAAEAIAPTLPARERETAAFVTALCAADLPLPITEAALANLSTLRSTTVFRTPDGYLFGWEGCHDSAGCCHGSCTHVWNYEQATPFLFGDLARGMREVEFLHATRDADGLMAFRVALPLARAMAWPVAAADGQLGCLMKLYREWQLSGDAAFLRRLWPRAKRALEFCWIPKGWDGDADGVMEGCQHNTMDVEYFGPNGQMQGWYLGALRAGEEMARALGDDAFAARCRTLFEQGKAWTDTHLFNGAYYEHAVRPPLSADNIAEGLRAHMGAADFANPEFQLGTACLVDQLVGQYMAHVCGLGYLLDPSRVRAALASIYRFNFRALAGHFNNMRTYALQDEQAVLMATYPHGDRPRWPFPYFNEVMTGFEYTAAVGMLYEEMGDEGLAIIAAIRKRYDGLRRNPFNEAECGNHYARAMASWAAILAFTGFHYAGPTGTLTLSAQAGRQFWSTGSAWGIYTQELQSEHITMTLAVSAGVLPLQTLVLTGFGAATLPARRTLTAGEAITLVVAQG
jgi:non-lysosomal glucosylceramidase